MTDASNAAIAPSRSADFIWLCRLPMAITRTPRLDRTRMNLRPIGPHPITTVESPGRIPVSSTPRNTQASGSMSAASMKDMPAGISIRFSRTIRPGITVY